MRISKKAIEIVKTTTKIKNLLALRMEVTGFTIERWVTENEENGNLTKAIALEVISQETGIETADLLEETATLKAS